MKKLMFVLSVFIFTFIISGCTLGQNETSIDVQIISSDKVSQKYIYHVYIENDLSITSDLLEIANDTSRQIFDLISQEVGTNKRQLTIHFHNTDTIEDQAFYGYISFHINFDTNTPGLSLIENRLKQF